nr:amidase family protein [Acidimangrovimonas sediminis]
METARDIDRRRAAGAPVGPLAGVPVVIKDPMDMKGCPTTAGWRPLSSGAGGVDLMPTMTSKTHFGGKRKVCRAERRDLSEIKGGWRALG